METTKRPIGRGGRWLLAAALLLPRDDGRAEAQRDLAAGRYAAARARLLPLVAVAPDDIELRCLLAFAQSSLGDGDAALAHADAAVALAPTLAAPHYQRGRALLLRHAFADADAAFDAARTRDPNFFPEWRAHFQAQAALGCGDEARAQQLYAQSPEASAPWADPAFLFERMGALHPIVPDVAPARGWYRRAADLYFRGPPDAPRPPPESFELPPPVRGEWRVMQGNFGDESHFGIAGSYCFDWMKVERGELRRPGGTTRESWYSWDAPLYAPSAARVVRAVDECDDQRAHAGDLAPLATLAVRTQPLGNHLVLEVAPDRYLLLAHLKRGSLAVREGERVAAGTRLATLGQSGVSYAPHLHATLWRSLDPPIGMPWKFTDCARRRANGALERGAPFTPEAGDAIVFP